MSSCNTTRYYINSFPREWQIKERSIAKRDELLVAVRNNAVTAELIEKMSADANNLVVEYALYLKRETLAMYLICHGYFVSVACLRIAIEHNLKTVAHFLVDYACPMSIECLKLAIQKNQDELALKMIQCGCESSLDCLRIAIVLEKHAITCALIDVHRSGLQQLFVHPHVNPLIAKTMRENLRSMGFPYSITEIGNEVRTFNNHVRESQKSDVLEDHCLCNRTIHFTCAMH